MIYVTGDTHGRFARIAYFCRLHHTTKADVLVILGDAGINVYGKELDDRLKKQLETLPITLLCIHGNHEMRPESISTYQQVQWHGGVVYQEEAYPDLLFAKDGEVYDLGGRQTLVIGGAYSVDKLYRILNDMHWFADEQPSDAVKARVEQKLDVLGWQVDTVLSHTVPLKYEPREVFLHSVDQRQVDKSTEEWLDAIENRLQYSQWLAGHYHTEKTVDKLRIMYEEVALFADDSPSEPYDQA